MKPLTKFKKWALIYTDLSTKAVYLNSILSLTTSEVRIAFQTLFANRGMPKVIPTDNVTQFNLIQKYFSIFWRDFAKSETIPINFDTTEEKWPFMPAKTSWFSGVYEKLIQAIKDAYYNTLSHYQVHHLIFQSTLKNTQVMVNERSLCPALEGAE